MFLLFQILLISRQHQDCLVSVLGFGFYLNSFVVRKYTIYDLNPFSLIEICVTPRIWSLLANILCALEGEIVLCCRWVKCSVNISQVKWVGAGVQLFWLIFCLLDLPVIERKVVKCATLIVDLFISPFSLYQLRLHVFWSFIIRCKNI